MELFPNVAPDRPSSFEASEAFSLPVLCTVLPFCVVPLWLSNLAGTNFQPSHKRVRNLTSCSHTVAHTTFHRFNLNRIPLDGHEVLDGEEIAPEGVGVGMDV